MAKRCTGVAGGHGFIKVEVNLLKTSFWSSRCHALIGEEIGSWFRANGLIPWPTRRPPKLIVEQGDARTFRVKCIAN